MKFTLSLAFVYCLFLVGCNSAKQVEQRQAAEGLLKASETCVASVRDRGLLYEDSPSCMSLGELSGMFIKAGGFADDADKESFLKFEQARMHAWMALAISESRGKKLRIW
jgi:hypothetical protein